MFVITSCTGNGTYMYQYNWKGVTLLLLLSASVNFDCRAESAAFDSSLLLAQRPLDACSFAAALNDESCGKSKRVLLCEMSAVERSVVPSRCGLSDEVENIDSAVAVVVGEAP